VTSNLINDFPHIEPKVPNNLKANHLKMRNIEYEMASGIEVNTRIYMDENVINEEKIEQLYKVMTGYFDDLCHRISSLKSVDHPYSKPPKITNYKK
jgi:hypothetical protein